MTAIYLQLWGHGRLIYQLKQRQPKTAVNRRDRATANILPNYRRKELRKLKVIKTQQQ
jgi:hypothetical protein